MPKTADSGRDPMARIFFKSAVSLLFITACGKVAMAFGDSPILDQPSPVLHLIPNRALLCLASGLEIAAALLVLRAPAKCLFKAVVVACLAMLFIGYRSVLWMTGFHGYCDCLGNIAEAIHLTPEEANVMSVSILVYLAVGSCWFLIKTWRLKTNERKAL